MLAAWLAEPHVAEWWDEVPRRRSPRSCEAMDSVSIEPLIVELDGRPIAYIQSYDPHLEDGHPYQDQPFGTLGIDISIGLPELVGNGHGSAHRPAVLRQAVRGRRPARDHRSAIRPIARAIRAYEKAGFRAFDTRTSIYGPALMMARDAE